MNKRLLLQRLAPVSLRYGLCQLAVQLSICWLAGLLLVGFFFSLHRWQGWASPTLWILPAIITLLMAINICFRIFGRNVDWESTAHLIEKHRPELNSLLITAVEQKPDPATGRLNFLQERLILAAVNLSYKGEWRNTVPTSRIVGLHGLQFIVFIAFAVSLYSMHDLKQSRSTIALVYENGVTITPGDVALEKGNSLAVMAHFKGTIPTEALLVYGATNQLNQRIAMTKNLSDPVFGVSLSNLQSNLYYRIEYDGKSSRQYSVSVFEYPRVERIDVKIESPSYTKLADKIIEDTHRISAVEGSKIQLTIQMNKPVKSAKIQAKDVPAVDFTLIQSKPLAILTNLHFQRSQRCEIVVVDSSGRTNKTPASLFVDVLTNKAPTIKLLAPVGDQKVSALEEVQFRSEMSDDFGLQQYGFSYSSLVHGDREVTLGSQSGAKEKKTVGYLLPVENLVMKSGDIISYYFWAEDLDRDGKKRRVASDIFFAEIRPFEEIFRQGQSQDENSQDSEQQSSSSSESQANQSARLAEMQKDVLTATWKLYQRHLRDEIAQAQYKKDLAVVKESQEKTLTQATEAVSRATNPQRQASLTVATEAMKTALKHLADAEKQPSALSQATAAEQAAYQSLLRQQENEYQVSQRNSRNSRSSRSSANSRSQRQLNQLEMKSSENRYETQRQASSPPEAGSGEQQEMLNRLKELARRQEDLNQQLKDMQTALQEAKNNAEQEEIRRRLKRLQEDQRQMLGDVDEMQQQLDRNENSSRQSDSRQQLQQARNNVRQAADAMERGQVPEALNSGVRAQRNLAEARDELRQESAGRFSEEMRQLRSAARSLTQNQEELGNRLRSLNEPGRRTLRDDGGREEVVKGLDEQKQALTNLVNQATQVAQQAEATEPLLFKKLYDTLRNSQQDQLDNAMDVAKELVKRSFLPQAIPMEQKVREGMQELRDGVEQAAEAVLGNEREALTRAQRELQSLAQEVNRELQQSQSNVVNRVVTDSSQASTNAANTNISTLAGLWTNRSQTNSSLSPQARNRGGRGQETGQDQQARSQAGERQAGSQNGDQAQTARSDSSRRGETRQGQNREAQNRDNQANPTGRGGNDIVWDNQWQGPITGENYSQWVNRLRDVEDMLDYPDLRNQLTRVRERAQAARAEFKRHGISPKWQILKSQVSDPLAEVQQRIQDELARKNTNNWLVPLDRDPVPSRYAEGVRRYYEQLAREK